MAESESSQDETENSLIFFINSISYACLINAHISPKRFMIETR